MLVQLLKQNNERLKLAETQKAETDNLIKKQDSEIRRAFLLECKELFNLFKLNKIEYRVQEYAAPYVEIKIQICNGMWLEISLRTDKNSKQNKPYAYDYRSSYSTDIKYKQFDTFEEMIVAALGECYKDKKHFTNNFHAIYEI